MYGWRLPKKKIRTSRSRPGKIPRGLSEHAGGGDHDSHHDSRWSNATTTMAAAIAGTDGSV